MTTAVRVISLKSSAERREAMVAQLNTIAGLDWAFFDALDEVPAHLTHDARRARQILRRDMSKGELGCFASHVSLWHWFVASEDYDQLVVLEDDVIIDRPFFEQIDKLPELLPRAEFLRLYAKAPTPAKVVAFIMGRHVVRYNGIAFGTQGYILRKSAAQKLVQSIDTIVRPIDDEMDRYWVHDVLNYGLFPFPIMEVGTASTIGHSRRQVDSSFMAFAQWKWHRIINSLARRWCNLKLSFRRERI